MINILLHALSLDTQPAWLLFLLDSLLVLLIALLLQLIARVVDRKIRAPTETAIWNQWHAIISQVVYSPICIAIWAIAFIHIVENFVLTVLVNKQELSLVYKGQNFIILLLVAWTLSRLITLIVAKFEENIQATSQIRHTVNVVSISARTLLLIIVTLVAMDSVFGVGLGAVAGWLAGSALIVGYAAKETIANFISAMVIFVDNPFTIGDWIRSPDRNIEGTVEYIGWRNTIIRTFDKRPLYVPNSLFTTISVENASRMRNRRIKKIIGIRYQDLRLANKITDEINALFQGHPDLDKRNTTFATLINFAPSSADIQIYCFTKTREWVPYLNVQQAILIAIADIIENNGAEIAFPTTTLDLPKEFPTFNISNQNKPSTTPRSKAKSPPSNKS